MFFIREANVCFKPPRCIFGSVRNGLGVMLCQPGLKVVGDAGVKTVRLVNALKNINVFQSPLRPAFACYRSFRLRSYGATARQAGAAAFARCASSRCVGLAEPSPARLRCYATSARQPSLAAHPSLGRLAEPKLAQRAKAGGARGSRTPDLLNAIQALSQLSYGPL